MKQGNVSLRAPEPEDLEVMLSFENDADRVVRSYVFINSLWKKNGLVGNVRTKM